MRKTHILRAYEVHPTFCQWAKATGCAHAVGNRGNKITSFQSLRFWSHPQDLVISKYFHLSSWNSENLENILNVSNLYITRLFHSNCGKCRLHLNMIQLIKHLQYSFAFFFFIWWVGYNPLLLLERFLYEMVFFFVFFEESSFSSSLISNVSVFY